MNDSDKNKIMAMAMFTFLIWLGIIVLPLQWISHNSKIEYQLKQRNDMFEQSIESRLRHIESKMMTHN